MSDRQCQVTADGRIKVGDMVTITADWAHRLRVAVYDGRKTVEQLRAEHTGRVIEIWTGAPAYPWWSILVACESASPWSAADDLEIVQP